MIKSRLEALTDGIVAIAATIMVLELVPPEELTLNGYLSLWPVFLAYLISFWMIYVVWYNHSNILKKAQVIKSRTFLFNGLWIFLVTLVPFTTHLVGEHPENASSQIIYLGNLLLWMIAAHLMDKQIVKDNNLSNVPTSFISRNVLYIVLLLTMLAAVFIPYISLIVLALLNLFTMSSLLRNQ